MRDPHRLRSLAHHADALVTHQSVRSPHGPTRRTILTVWPDQRPMMVGLVTIAILVLGVILAYPGTLSRPGRAEASDSAAATPVAESITQVEMPASTEAALAGTPAPTAEAAQPPTSSPEREMTGVQRPTPTPRPPIVRLHASGTCQADGSLAGRIEASVTRAPVVLQELKLLAPDSTSPLNLATTPALPVILPVGATDIAWAVAGPVQLDGQGVRIQALISSANDPSATQTVIADVRGWRHRCALADTTPVKAVDSGTPPASPVPESPTHPSGEATERNPMGNAACMDDRVKAEPDLRTTDERAGNEPAGRHATPLSDMARCALQPPSTPDAAPQVLPVTVTPVAAPAPTPTPESPMLAQGSSGNLQAAAASRAELTDLKLPTVTYSHSDQQTTGTLLLTVDSLASPAVLSWNVTIQASNFIAQPLTSAASIPAANLVLLSASPPERIAGKRVTSAGPSVPSTLTLPATLDTPRKVLQARAAAGVYEQSLEVQLTIPGTTPAGSYVSDITVTFGVGP